MVKCQGSLPKTKGKTHYIVKMMHIAKLKDIKETIMMKVLKMGALMYQIHMKPEAVLLSRFGFRLGCLESL